MLNKTIWLVEVELVDHALHVYGPITTNKFMMALKAR